MLNLDLAARQRRAATLLRSEVEAVRVKISLAGFASLFWSANYWYRASEGVLLRYSSEEHGVETVGELVTEKSVSPN